MEPVCQIIADLPLWLLRPDVISGHLALETRDGDRLQVNFRVVDSHSGRDILRDYRHPGGWWAGLDEFHDGKLFFHDRADQKYGTHRGITVVQAASGKALWQLPAYSFYGLTPDYLVGRAAAETLHLVGLNPESGAVVVPALDPVEAKAGMQKLEESRQAGHQVPDYFPPEQQYFKELQTFLHRTLGMEIAMGIDYLETNRYFILGFYTAAANNRLNYQVAAFSPDGRLLLREQLGSDLQGIGSDNFFILKDTVILIQNRKTLLGYVL